MRNKFVWGLLLFLSLILVGCGDKETNDRKKDSLTSTTQTIKCTKEEVDEDRYKNVENMIITTKKDKVKKVSSPSVMEMDPEYISFTLSFGQAFATKFNEIEGMEMKYEQEGEKAKEDSSLYNSKDLFFEDFKKESLEGYTCDK